MSDRAIILTCLVVSILALSSLFVRRGSRDGLFVVGAFFCYFSFGPVLNYLLGNPIYPGTVVSRIPQACFGFTLALLALAAVGKLYPQRGDYRLAKLNDTRHRYEVLAVTFAAVIAYAAAITLVRAPGLLGATKNQALDLAGPGHRVYLFLAVCLTSFFFVTRRTALLRWLYSAHCLTFILYSAGFRERDFLFAFLSVFLHRELLSERGRSLKVVLVASVSAVFATLLFSLRAGGGFNTAGFLNQGLLIFIDTYLMEQVPGSRPFESGGTYLAALERLPPRFLYDSGEVTLSEWFVESYNPGGTSGYGFSLSGEAYLNFGLLGIPIVFALVAVAHRYLINRIDRSDWFAFGSIYFTATWMYALRGDSLQLLKTLLFGAIFFAIVRLLSSKARTPVPLLDSAA